LMGACPTRRAATEEPRLLEAEPPRRQPLAAARRQPLAAARWLATAAGARARAKRLWRAAVNLIKHHLRKRLAWHWYGKRLQKKPGLGAIFDRVVRRKGKLQNV
jgi:hypothetical protein